MQFVDAGGDFVTTYAVDTSEGKCLMVECVAAIGSAPAPLMLNPAMARTLAADLIAFADSAERERRT